MVIALDDAVGIGFKRRPFTVRTGSLEQLEYLWLHSTPGRFVLQISTFLVLVERKLVDVQRWLSENGW